MLLKHRMEFSYLDGREGDEHNGIGFGEISKMTVPQDKFYLKQK